MHVHTSAPVRRASRCTRRVFGGAPRARAFFVDQLASLNYAVGVRELHPVRRYLALQREAELGARDRWHARPSAEPQLVLMRTPDQTYGYAHLERPAVGGKGTLLFSIANAVNGGLVGAVGPSLPAFQASTGLGAAGLGRLVLLNRCSKLLGTFAWTAYAKQLINRGTAVPSPRLLLCICMLMASASAAVIASPALRDSKLALQSALGFFGVSYGFTDPGFTLLTIWSLQDSARHQRTHVGYLNAGYTLGALVTPLIVAALLSWGDGSCYPVFYIISAVAAMAGLALMASPVASHEGVSPPAAAEKTASTPEGTPLQAKDRAAAAATDPWRDTIIVAGMSVILCCVTGCEHGVATWLPSALA